MLNTFTDEHPAFYRQWGRAYPLHSVCDDLKQANALMEDQGGVVGVINTCGALILMCDKHQQSGPWDMLERPGRGLHECTLEADGEAVTLGIFSADNDSDETVWNRAAHAAGFPDFATCKPVVFSSGEMEGRDGARRLFVGLSV